MRYFKIWQEFLKGAYTYFKKHSPKKSSEMIIALDLGTFMDFGAGANSWKRPEHIWDTHGTCHNTLPFKIWNLNLNVPKIAETISSRPNRGGGGRAPQKTLKW